MLPARMFAALGIGYLNKRAVILFFALTQIEEAYGRIHDNKEPYGRDDIADNNDPEPEMREECRKFGALYSAITRPAETLVDETEEIFDICLRDGVHRS